MFKFFKKSAKKLKVITVPESVLADDAKDYALMMAIVNWFNKVQNEGAFLMGEMPAAACQAYHADYYLAQVNNGGHAQFALNSQMNPVVLHWALEGLKAAGLDEMYQCLKELEAMKLSLSNMDDYRALVQSGQVAPLDTRFFANSKNFYPKFNEYVIDFVEYVPDDEYDEYMKDIIALDDIRGARLKARKIMSIEGSMLDSHKMASGIGAAVLGNVAQHFLGGGYIVFAGDTVAQMNVIVQDKKRAYVMNNPSMKSFIFSFEKIESNAGTERLLEFAKKAVNIKYDRLEDEMKILREKRYGRVLAWLLCEHGGTGSFESAAPLVVNKDALSEGKPAQYVASQGGLAFLFAISDTAYRLAAVSGLTGQQGFHVVAEGKTSVALKAANEFVEKSFPNMS